MQYFFFPRQKFWESFGEKRMIFDAPKPAETSVVQASKTAETIDYNDPANDARKKLEGLKETVDLTMLLVKKAEFIAALQKDKTDLKDEISAETEKAIDDKITALNNSAPNSINPILEIQASLEKTHTEIVALIQNDLEFVLAEGKEEDRRKFLEEKLKSFATVGSDAGIKIEGLITTLLTDLKIEGAKAKENATLILGTMMSQMTTEGNNAIRYMNNKWEVEKNGSWTEFKMPDLIEKGRETIGKGLESVSQEIYQGVIDNILLGKANSTEKAMLPNLFFDSYEGKSFLVKKEAFSLDEANLNSLKDKFNWIEFEKIFGKDDESGTKKIEEGQKQTIITALKEQILQKKEEKLEGHTDRATIRLFVGVNSQEKFEIMTEEEKNKEEKNITAIAKGMESLSDNAKILGKFHEICNVQPLVFATDTPTPIFKNADGTMLSQENFGKLLPTELKSYEKKIYDALVAESTADTTKKALYLTTTGKLTPELENVGIIQRMKQIDDNKELYRHENKTKIGLLGTFLSMFGIDVLDPNQSGGLVSLIRWFSNVPEPGSVDDAGGARKYSYEQDEEIAKKYLGSDFDAILDKKISAVQTLNDRFEPTTLKDAFNKIVADKKESGVRMNNLLQDVLGRFDGINVTAVEGGKITFTPKEPETEKKYVQLMTFLQPSTQKADKASQEFGEKITSQLSSFDITSLMETGETATKSHLRDKIEKKHEEKHYADIGKVKGDGKNITVQFGGEGIGKKVAGLFGMDFGKDTKVAEQKASDSSPETTTA